MSPADTPTVARLLRDYAQRTALRRGNPNRSKAYSRGADTSIRTPIQSRELDHMHCGVEARSTSAVNRRSNLTPHRRPILTPSSGGF